MLIDERWMAEALKEAIKAYDAEEVPVGAIIIHKGVLVAKAHNQVNVLKDPTAHAEMIAITQAASAVGDWRLNGCKIYVTKEPCVMCAGALLLARVDEIIYGMPDPKEGACGSKQDVLKGKNIGVKSGIREEDCRNVIQSFFQEKRKKQIER